jgi:hypothetical protein
MWLERNGADVVPEIGGFSFSMRIVGTNQDVGVWLSDDVRDDKDLPLSGEALREAFDSDKQAFEDLASHRHTHGRVSATGRVEIGSSDISGIMG